MSDPAIPQPQAAKPKLSPRPVAAGGAAQILVDFGPVALFMIAYNLAHRGAYAAHAIFIATGLFMAATLAALIYAIAVQKRTPPMLIVTAVVVAIFGGLTIWLHNPVFIKIKPTIVNLLFAAAIFGGLAFKQNVWKILLQGSLDLPERIWTIFALRYGFFFVFLAGLNEVVWRNFSESFWANFKFLGVMPITLAFAVANIPLLVKHIKKVDAPEDR
jgi:intracellular septation protein